MPRDAELKRGKIYFLVPVSSLPGKTRSGSITNSKKNEKEQDIISNGTTRSSSSSLGGGMTTKLLISDQYLTEILSDKVSTQRERRRGRIGVWRPHLSSISETTIHL
ncbi:Protein of unknown function DUF4228 [Macleaya cordata]|uniref:Uncharacterized protein n=1 Tax=Macleaya cordata TaxID=56857 RepID=A0A200PT86_MACCD|nr:Protein of unknown function DUF4228 [Macleaya cordata]